MSLYALLLTVPADLGRDFPAFRRLLIFSTKLILLSLSAGAVFMLHIPRLGFAT